MAFVAFALAPWTSAQNRLPASAEIDAYLTGVVRDTRIPGIVALVVDADRVVYTGAFGRQNVAAGVPMAEDSIFRIASMTKPVTSVAVMMLVQEGDIGLDDPVSDYLPAFEDKQVIENFNPADKTYTTRPAARPMTVRHLLTHTSGLGYAFSNHTLAALVGAEPGASVTRFPLLHDPGARWTYGESTRVLGTLVEEVSGQALDEFLSERIFVPLGMSDTFYTVPAPKAGRVVTVHRTTPEGLVETPNPAEITAPVYGDGGLHSTAADYAKFIQLFLNDGRAPNGMRLLSEATVALMGENHIGAIFVEQQPAALPALTRAVSARRGPRQVRPRLPDHGPARRPVRALAGQHELGRNLQHGILDRSRARRRRRAADAVPAVLRRRRDRDAARLRAARLRGARRLASRPRPSPLAGAAFGAMAALIWAGFPAITKLSMASNALDAWDITALRFGVAGLLLLPLFARRRLRQLCARCRRCSSPAAPAHRTCCLTAGGLAFAPGGHMGVITPSCMLLCSTLGSRLILKEPLTAAASPARSRSRPGSSRLGWDGLANHGELTWLGDAMFVLGGLFWASYTIGSRVWRVEPLHATAVVGVLSMVLYLPGYAWLAGADLAAAPWREIVIQAVFQGVLSADRRAAPVHARRRDPGRRARRRVRGARADVLAADRDPAAARDADASCSSSASCS